MRALAFVVLTACGTNTTTGATDAAADAATCEIDASYTCDVSSLSQAALLCGTWAGGTGGDNTSVSCPASLGFGWDVSTSTRNPPCTYKWTKGGLPDPCGLPTNDAGAFAWLSPACEGGVACP